MLKDLSAQRTAALDIEIEEDLEALQRLQLVRLCRQQLLVVLHSCTVTHVCATPRQSYQTRENYQRHLMMLWLMHACRRAPVSQMNLMCSTMMSMVWQGPALGTPKVLPVTMWLICP